MEKRFQYETEEQIEQLKIDNSDLFLIRRENLFTGDFIVFSDTKPQVPESRVIDKIQNDMDYLILNQEGLI
jgi:hypothetical protein